jgi:hypothetical protein
MNSSSDGELVAKGVQDERPFGRQLDAAARSREARDAELGLKSAELPRDRRIVRGAAPRRLS